MYKKTLTEIDNPEYVYIWINPEEKAIVICSCEKGSKDAVKIEQKKDCEIYSSKLFHELGVLAEGSLMEDSTYKLDGRILYGNKMAKFDINSAERLSSDAVGKGKGQYE